MKVTDFLAIVEEDRSSCYTMEYGSLPDDVKTFDIAFIRYPIEYPINLNTILPLSEDNYFEADIIDWRGVVKASEYVFRIEKVVTIERNNLLNYRRWKNRQRR